MKIEISCDKDDIERQLRLHFEKSHTALVRIETLMKVWTLQDVREDVINVRKDLCKLQKQCDELLSKVYE